MKILLPRPTTGAEPDGAALLRLVAELTQILNDHQQRIEELEGAQYIETNLARPPRQIGAKAVVGNDVYIATGITPADWVQVN